MTKEPTIYCQQIGCKKKGKEITEYKEIPFRRKTVTIKRHRSVEWENKKVCMECNEEWERQDKFGLL